MGEADRQFFDDLIITDRPRDACHLHIWWKKLTNKMIAIKCAHAITPNTTSDGRHMIEMWVIAHCSHGCVQVTGELGIHMLLKQIDHRLRCHDIPPFYGVLELGTFSTESANSGHYKVSYSMISSASADRFGGTSMPSALAVLRLMTNSNLVDCTTGKSPGFSPLRILPT